MAHDMAHDDDEPFLRGNRKRINFEEESVKFFDPEAAADDFLHANRQPVEESIQQTTRCACTCARWARYRC